MTDRESPEVHREVIGLFKFGPRKYMERLVREGEVYMRPLADFLEMESDDLRRDPDEGISYNKPARGSILKMQEGADWLTIGTINGSLRFRADGIRQVNVYCMYALRGDQTRVDDKNYGFGDTFVAFTDGDEFLRRLAQEAERVGLTVSRGIVGYVNLDTYEGDMGPLRKSDRFRYQSEVRVLVTPGSSEPLILKLGDISDITMIGEAETLNDRISVVPLDSDEG